MFWIVPLLSVAKTELNWFEIWLLVTFSTFFIWAEDSSVIFWKIEIIRINCIFNLSHVVSSVCWFQFKYEFDLLEAKYLKFISYLRTAMLTQSKIPDSSDDLIYSANVNWSAWAYKWNPKFEFLHSRCVRPCLYERTLNARRREKYSIQTLQREKFLRLDCYSLFIQIDGCMRVNFLWR